ncbi:MAG TPA: histidine phosphatase family protein [Stellaceae bacterium]|nr:histidine phosphatase family protein [Stellaceae bacterium]
MRTLHLLRHAKSAANEGTDDHERGLSRRGVAAARLVGRTLPAATGALDLVLCSDAVRTRATMDLVLSRYAEPPRISLEPALYLANRNQLLARLRRLSEDDRNVLVIGHNPGLHDLALALAASGSPAYAALAGGKFPTAARASFAIATAWSALGGERHQLFGYVTPSSLGEEEG